MKIKQLYTPKDFKKLDKVLMFDIWYRQALTDKKIGKLFGVTADEVKKRREELGIKWMNSAIASLSGGATFTSKKKLIEIHPPKDWDGEPIPFKPGKNRTTSDYKVSGFESEGNAIGPIKNIKESADADKKNIKEFSADEAAAAWKEMREQEIAEKEATIDIDEQSIIDEVETRLQIKDSNGQSK